MMTVHCYSYIVTLTRCYCVQPPKPCVVSSYAVLPYGMPLPDTRIAPPPSTANCTASNRHTLSSLLSQFDSQINPHTHCMPIRPIIDRPHRGSSCPSSAPVVCMACMCKQASGARGAAAASCPPYCPTRCCCCCHRCRCPPLRRCCCHRRVRRYPPAARAASGTACTHPGRCESRPWQRRRLQRCPWTRLLRRPPCLLPLPFPSPRRRQHSG